MNPRPGGARGLAAWCIERPIGVAAITAAVVVLGATTLGLLRVDLLPKVVRPEVRVRVFEANVPAAIMEDRVTRVLEEQLALTEGAIGVQSHTREGRSAVDLVFDYGTDIDRALQDASTRLDRARGALPDSADPPSVYKSDPSQQPVLELAVSGTTEDPAALREWAAERLRKWIVNVPGVAAVTVSGGSLREIQVLPDPARLAAVGMDVLDLAERIRKANRDTPVGRLVTPSAEIGGRVAGRARSLDELRALPLGADADSTGPPVRLGDIAVVQDIAAGDRVRVRLNGQPAVKISVGKAPQANTVEVVEAVHQQLDWLRAQRLVPSNFDIRTVDDAAVFVRHALDNATQAAIGGAVLAMLVVYLFLGNLRRTLIIGSAIPIAILVTLALMALGGLTLNLMTLGGLALGVGMLVDNTIVMLEQIARRQRENREAALPETTVAAGAAGEVSGAIFASTTTNLAAVLPFLFVTGLIGLLFRELIFTISAAVVASAVVALTLVPALAARVQPTHGRIRAAIERGFARVEAGYAALVARLLRFGWLVAAALVAAFAVYVPPLVEKSTAFLPRIDEGRAYVAVRLELGTSLERMDALVTQVENQLRADPAVDSVLATVGGWTWGRNEYQNPSRASLLVHLKPAAERGISTREWAANKYLEFAPLRGPGVRIWAGALHVHGLSLHTGDDDLALRIAGPDLDELDRLGDALVQRLNVVDGLSNVEHSSDVRVTELAVRLDRARAAPLGLTDDQIGRVLRIALDGERISDFIDGDELRELRLRLPAASMRDAGALDRLVVYSQTKPRVAVPLAAVASTSLVSNPANIHRDRQQRSVEISAGLKEGVTLPVALQTVQEALTDFELPEGYLMYDGGTADALHRNERLVQSLLALAVFLVFVVLAVQYESLRNPLVILTSVPFALIGVALALKLSAVSVSMPVWLGVIMLAGIVVNNAIVLIEAIELRRRAGVERVRAIALAAGERLRPILMTTLTTVVGLLPLALAWGEGAEMLQPLAITIAGGLSFSLIVSLIFVPVAYRHLGRA
ncbi:MAG: efflux RND transporter permease subunit [Chromatiales bacterium]|nr:efflux RND transporter permease subunit [Chromatiales bacterium]